MRSPFSIKWIHFIERRSFHQKYKFCNKKDMVSAWRNFKNIFPRPLFIIIFRPEMLKFHPYSSSTGDTRVEFVIYCVLSPFYRLKLQIKPHPTRSHYPLSTYLNYFPNAPKAIFFNKKKLIEIHS